jgi:nucleoside 2-deoxyribosyltransferase
MYYFATPHVNTNVKENTLDFEKLARNEKLCKALEENGIEVFLPYRDADQSLAGKDLLEKELQVIRDCEGMIVALSNTRGIYLEAGYAKALGKKIIGLKVEETRDFSDWGKAFFDYIAQDTSDLIKYFKDKN